MVLFDEDPVELMSEATSKFHIAPDKDSLSRVATTLSTLSASRAQRLALQQSTLQSLSRRLNNLQSACSYEEERHDASRHAQEMLEKDTEKFRMAKSCSDVEREGERLDGELAALRQQLATVEKEGVEGGRQGPGRQGEDEMVLKLHVYRSLGIDFVADERGGWQCGRAVIRNGERGDVNVVHVDGTTTESRAYPKLFWESL